MDGSTKSEDPSTKTTLNVDGSTKSEDPSTKTALYVDEHTIWPWKLEFGLGRWNLARHQTADNFSCNRYTINYVVNVKFWCGKVTPPLFSLTLINKTH